jgi:hypothetical protein
LKLRKLETWISNLRSLFVFFFLFCFVFCFCPESRPQEIETTIHFFLKLESNSRSTFISAIYKYEMYNFIIVRPWAKITIKEFVSNFVTLTPLETLGAIHELRIAKSGGRKR